MKATGARFGGPFHFAAEIEDIERWVALDGPQQRFDVLADVVIACALRMPAALPKVEALRPSRALEQRGADEGDRFG